MDAQLHDFIRNPSWELGTLLIEKYSGQISETRLSFINKHQNSFTLEMLIEELSQIARQQPQPEDPKPIAPDPVERHEKAYHVEFRLPAKEDLPKDLVELRENVIALLRSQQEGRGVLKALAYAKDTDKKSMYEVAGTILSKESQLQKAYILLDYYARHKKHYPGTEPKSDLDRIKDLVRRQIINYTYINKYKKSPKPEVQAEITRRQAELDELNKWLDE